MACAGDVDAAGAAEELRNFTGSTPVLATAVRRLAQYRHHSDRSKNGKQGSESSAAADAQWTSTMQMAATALLCTLPKGQDSAAAAAAAQPPVTASHAAPLLPGASPAVRSIAAYLLTAPRLVEAVPAGVRAQLTSLTTFLDLLPALGELAGAGFCCATGRSGQSSFTAASDAAIRQAISACALSSLASCLACWAVRGSSPLLLQEDEEKVQVSRDVWCDCSPWPGEGLVWSNYLWALVNLTQLVSGVLVTKKLEVRISAVGTGLLMSYTVISPSVA